LYEDIWDFDGFVGQRLCDAAISGATGGPVFYANVDAVRKKLPWQIGRW
jgi:hypothetical protein